MPLEALSTRGRTPTSEPALPSTMPFARARTTTSPRHNACAALRLPDELDLDRLPGADLVAVGGHEGERVDAEHRREDV